ncbi:MAG: SDR family oxidoreductase [Candidatus Omnitrophota bacterium]
MRYLITGGAGFIGSHLAEYLLKQGHFVRVLDNFSSGKRENLSFTKELPPTKFELIDGDIRDKSACEKSCLGIDYVLHQAALRSVPKSMKDPQSYNDVNINGVLFMLQAALKAGIKRFVFASSSSVYGDTDKIPEKEKDYPRLISPYALTKLAGEYYCRVFSQSFGLETVSLRYFNVFGCRQALDDEYAVVIPKFIYSILHDQQPPVFGTGKQSRDFTYIDNVVQANVLAATTAGIREAVFNVANGKDHTILELVDLLNRILEKDSKPVFLPLRPGDVFRTCADISSIRKVLGYKPKVGFEEGLRRTAAWFSKSLKQ